MNQENQLDLDVRIDQKLDWVVISRDVISIAALILRAEIRTVGTRNCELERNWLQTASTQKNNVVCCKSESYLIIQFSFQHSLHVHLPQSSLTSISLRLAFPRLSSQQLTQILLSSSASLPF